MADIVARNRIEITAEDKTKQGTDSVSRNLRGMKEEALGLPPVLNEIYGRLGRLATYGAALALAKEFFAASDASKLLLARLEGVTGSAVGAQNAFAGLVEDARRLRAPIEEAGSGFVRIAGAVKELGGTIGQARQLNEILLATAKISGVTGQEATAAARQFAQALGSGVLQGDELRSILENNQELARQLAFGLGVSVGELRKLGSEGKLTADVVSNALLSRLPEIQARMAGVPITVADAFTQLKNELFLFVQQVDNGSKASNVFAGFLSNIAVGLGEIRAQFQDGNIVRGFGAVLSLATFSFDNLRGLANQRRPDAEFDARDYQAKQLETAETSVLGVAAAAKRTYDAALKVGEEFLTKQQKIVGQFGDSMKTIAAAIDATQKQIAGSSGPERAAAEERLVQLNKLRAAGMADVVKKLAEADAAERKRGTSLAKLTEEQKSFNKEFFSVVELMQDASEHGKKYDDVIEAVNNQYAAGAISLMEWIAGHNKAYETLSLVKRETDELARRSLKDYEDALKRNGASLAAGVEALEAQARAEEQRVRLFGLSEQAITNVAIAEEKRNLATLMSEDYDLASAEAIKARIAALERLGAAQGQMAALDYTRQAVDAQKREYDDLFGYIDSLGREAWGAVTDSAGDAAQKIRKVFETQVLGFLYKLTVQPFLVNITAQLTGVSGGAAGLLGGSGGLSGLLNNLFGGIGNTSNAGPIQPTFGSSFAGGLLSPLSTLGSIFGGDSAGFGGLLNTLGAGLGALTPVLGLLTPLISSLFKPGGGPKDGGFASIGDIRGIGNTDGNGRWFTPSGSDSTVRTIVEATAESYNTLIRQLGGTAGNVGFALGFDTDPKGKAPDRVHAGAFLDGVQIYDAALGDLGRDPAVTQAALALESKRVILAALQASDLPEYLASILDQVDVATADAAAIDKVLAMATALKQAVDVVGALGDQFSALDPTTQIQGLVDAFGGLEQFVAGFQFLDANFTTDADKAARATDRLNAAFASLGFEVPQSHQAFLDLLNGIDLATTEGQGLYASMVQLAPAFTAVYGTAQQAADAENELAEARRQAIAAAEEFFNANFYTEAEQQQRNLAARIAEVATVSASLGIEIPTTVAGFRALIEGLDLSTEAGRAFYEALLPLAPAVLDIANAGQQLVDVAEQLGVIQVGGIFQQAESLASEAQQKIANLVAQSGGDYGEKLALTLKLTSAEAKRFEALAAAEYSMFGNTEQYQKLMAAAQVLKNMLGGTAAELARFTVLMAQYDAQRAEQLVQLEKWYAEQQALFAGNSEALAALQQIFQDKWAEIIAGVSEGVEGAISELERLRANLLEYVASLQVGNLSPLSTMAKLAEAKKQYEEQLALAQGGDLNALANISQYSNAYLTLAQQAFGSTSQYGAIFDLIIQQLTALGTPPSTGGTEPLMTIALAVPKDSPIVSKRDLEEAVAKLVDVALAGIAANASVVSKQTESLHSGLSKIERREKAGVLK